MQISVSISAELKRKLETIASRVPNGSRSNLAAKMILRGVQQVESGELDPLLLFIGDKDHGKKTANH